MKINHEHSHRDRWPMGSYTMKARALVAASLLAAGATGCGDDEAGDGGTAPGPRGDFSVVTQTTGVELDADGYEIRVNDVFAAVIGVNDTVEFVDRAAQPYEVELAQVADNCVVTGDNPRSLTVPANGSSETTFDVSCEETQGALEVVTSTTGEDPDDAYTLSIDGEEVGAIGANDAVRSTELETGDHRVRLGDVALNCRLVGDAERTVTVPSESTVVTAYDVVCTDSVGTLRVRTTTTGTFLDQDGYEVAVEAAAPVGVGINDVRDLGGVAAGPTSVRLLASSVAANCTVAGAGARSVTVPAGGLVEVLFEVACDVP